jgi:hypothetical protein
MGDYIGPTGLITLRNVLSKDIYDEYDFHNYTKLL